MSGTMPEGGFAHKIVWRIGRWALLGLALGAALTVPAATAHADYADAVSMPDAERRHRMMRRAAWAENDFMAQAELCRQYSDGDALTADPVEAYVWCSIAAYNTAFQGVSSAAMERYYRDVFEAGYAKRSQMQRRLSIAQRTEAYQRITYIYSCQGASGLAKLGELYHVGLGDDEGYDDPEFQRVRLQDPANMFDIDAHGRSAEEGYESRGREGNRSSDRGVSWWSRTNVFSGKSRDTGRSGAYGGSDYLAGAAEDYQDLFADGSELPRNTIEALTYYILAEEAGHPFAAELRTRLEADLAAQGRSDVGTIVQLARDGASEWMPPFEVYADGKSGAQGRYTDECPVSGQWEDALHRSYELRISDDQAALKWLGDYRGPLDGDRGPATREAIRAFQARNIWHVTGRLTSYQRTMLIRMAAVGGDQRSQETLGFMYACGVGVVADEVRAAHWYRKAFDQGSAVAAYNLGLLLRVEDANTSCLANRKVRRIEADATASERYFRTANSRGFQSFDPEIRRRLDLPLRAREQE